MELSLAARQGRLMRLLQRLGLVLILAASRQVQAETQAGAIPWKLAVGSTIALIYVTNPAKATRMFAEVGGGSHIKLARMGAQWDWHDNLLQWFGFRLGTYWQLDYAKWQSTLDSGSTGANNSLGLTPVFRFTGMLGDVKSYVETAIGIHLFSSSRINGDHYGTNFQFGDHIGVGIFFGARQQWVLGYRYLHHSNNSLGTPHNGIDFHLLSLAYTY